MNSIVSFFVFLSFLSVLDKEQINQPILSSNPSEIIPEGYKFFDGFAGDLNNDGLIDSVLLIKNTKDSLVLNRFDQMVDRNRRGIMVFFNQGNEWNLIAENRDCFLSENEDGGVYYAPELWIDIKENKLYIHYGHGRYGWWNYNFRYNGEDFELIGYDNSENRGPAIERNTSINFLTKKMRTRVYTSYNEDNGEQTFDEKWTELSIDKSLTLQEIEDFDYGDFLNQYLNRESSE